MSRPSPLKSVTAVLAALAIAGCAQTRGPDLVVNSHVEYNKAVSQVIKEELLLNVVRRRFMDPPQFVQVSSISTNFSTSVDVGASTTFADKPGRAWDSASADAGVSFTDSPTVTITPRQGADFAATLHSPLEVKMLSYLANTGYAFERMFWLLVESVNGVYGADVTYSHFSRDSDEFREVLDLFARLSERRQLIVGDFRWNDPYNDYPYPADQITPTMWITTVETGNRRWKSYDGGQSFLLTDHGMYPALWLSDSAKQSPDGQRLMELLNLDADVQKVIWVMEPARVPEGPDLATNPEVPRPVLKLRMRSMYNVLNMMALGVDVPAADVADGSATALTPYFEAVAAGKMFDIRKSFEVRWSEAAPEGAFLAVPYRGGWYYIADSDLESKVFFNGLFDLWQLSTRSTGDSKGPVLTLPVS